ncbi:MAG: putative ribosome biogenesis GTPase RsgA [Chlamydiae bacterium]|nr:putative ribosome biogenesis GTPase RsgA [Chlamydiota bacterium]
MKKKKKIDPDQIEEEFYAKDKKAGRQERKVASQKDRSKYKKTDFDKFQEELSKEILSKLDRDKLLKGRVISIKSEGIIVDTPSGQLLCELRGLLKKVKTRYKNLVAVGDFVLIEPLEHQEGFIYYVEPRKSTLSRADTISQKKQQLIAANIDQVLITTSVGIPPLKPSLVDRYIIATDKGNMEPVIVVNKIDLLDGDDQKDLLERFVRAHEKSGIQVVLVSAETGEGIEDLKAVMTDKASVFSGQSGVGKSSLINVITGLDLKVGVVVDRTRKGAHTTTHATLISLECGGWVIDTPGIKSFGMWDLDKEELPFYFEEFARYLPKCKFPNCSHLHEPDCAVIEAVEKGEISRLRYESYAALSKDIDEGYLRR